MMRSVSGVLAHPFFVVSAAYVLTYAFTVTALSGLFIRVPGDPSASASLLFLPHGVRIIAAWLYGWRAALYVLPGNYLTAMFTMRGEVFDPGVLIGPLFGVICASLCFDLLARLGMDLRLRSGADTNWRDIIVVGTLASAVNAVGANLFYQNGAETALIYFVGDVFGMLTLMLGLMWVFRVMRRTQF